MNGEELVKLEDVARSVKVSVFTINNWYAFKRLCPEHPMAKLLPDFIQSNPRQTRYWKKEDLKKIRDFKKHVVTGRNGFLGKATQRYVKKKGE